MSEVAHPRFVRYASYPDFGRPGSGPFRPRDGISTSSRREFRNRPSLAAFVPCATDHGSIYDANRVAHAFRPFPWPVTSLTRDSRRLQNVIIIMATTPKVTKTATKVAGKKKAPKDPNAPKRGKSAYFFFMDDERPKQKAAHPTASVAELAKFMGAEWNKIKETGAAKKYQDLAAKDKARYEKEKAAYEGKK